MNLNLHCEHHDFPTIPWHRLHRVRQIAPEFYDSLATCDSWVAIQWRYVTCAELGPWSRVRRRRE